jgi:hypothetical protein
MLVRASRAAEIHQRLVLWLVFTPLPYLISIIQNAILHQNRSTGTRDHQFYSKKRVKSTKIYIAFSSNFTLFLY